MRNHRLRERRLKLGVTQFELGCIAGWNPRSAQSAVSGAERIGGSPAYVDKVRRAIIWLECEPRRQRQAARDEAALVERTESALRKRPLDDDFLVRRLVNLLHDGRAEDYDRLSERVDAALRKRACDLYLDECTPMIRVSAGAPGP